MAARAADVRRTPVVCICSSCFSLGLSLMNSKFTKDQKKSKKIKKLALISVFLIVVKYAGHRSSIFNE